MTTIKQDINCKCIDKNILDIIKLSIITAKKAYENKSEELVAKEPQATPFEIEAMHEQTKKFHDALNKINKISEC